MDPPGYVTVDHVVQATGVRPGDFGLDDVVDPAAELEAILERWIGYVRSQIDGHSRRDFLDEAGGDPEAVLGSVRSVAERAMIRWVNIVRSSRESALIRLDEWRVGIDLVDDVLPASLRRDLPPPRGATSVRGFVSHG